MPHIGWDDGAALYALAFAVAAGREKVLAVDAGAGVGFSALWVLAALEDAGVGGRLIAVEVLKERFERLIETLSRAQAARVKAEAVLGDALEVVSSTRDRIDLAFVDIEKRKYLEVFETLADKLSEGGIAAFHNAFMAESRASLIVKRARALGWAAAIVPTGEGLLVVKRT